MGRSFTVSDEKFKVLVGERLILFVRTSLSFPNFILAKFQKETSAHLLKGNLDNTIDNTSGQQGCRRNNFLGPGGMKVG